MNVKYTSGLVLLLVGILGTPLAVLFFREQSPATNPPTPQIRLLDTPLARITPSSTYLPLTSISNPGKPNKPTPEPATTDWSDITNKPAGFADDLDNDVMAGLTCEIWQLARWNGSAWECFSQDLAELEARVATLEALHVPTPIPGLVSWWPGEGNAEDVVGGNNGTLQGGATFGTGMVGQGFSFDQFGDCEGARLRAGNVHSAKGWQEFIEPIVERYLKAAVRLLFRADAAFAKPELYDYLETRQIGYAIRLPANEVLEREIAHLLVRPTEWPSREPIISHHDFAYQAQSWNVSRRVVAKVEWHQGELFPRVGFIVTNLSYPTIGIVRFYNGRGTAEQWIKEGKYALNWTRLSCHKFVANQVRLSLFVLAYNLGNFMRRLALPEAMKHWSLTSLQTRLIKTGGRLVRHARSLVFQLAEVLVTREMLTGILERVSRLRLAPG